MKAVGSFVALPNGLVGLEKILVTSLGCRGAFVTTLVDLLRVSVVLCGNLVGLVPLPGNLIDLFELFEDLEKLPGSLDALLKTLADPLIGLVGLRVGLVVEFTGAAKQGHCEHEIHLASSIPKGHGGRSQQTS